MPTNHEDTYCTVAKNGTATLLARVVGYDGANITQSDISSATYAVWLLDEQDADSRTAVTGHGVTALTVSDIIYNTLQTDSIWTKDSTGYNFKHTVPISTNQAFAMAGREYLVEYKLTPASGEVIVVRFRVAVI